MHVLALSVELHLPECRSLKAKRSVLKPVTEGARRRFSVAVAETDHQNTWQRATVGVAAVAGSPGHAEEVIDEVERFIWSFPTLQVLSSSRYWLETD
jgi:uncharacterized protein YlxP (DUF503 family)